MKTCFAMFGCEIRNLRIPDFSFCVSLLISCFVYDGKEAKPRQIFPYYER